MHRDFGSLQAREASSWGGMSRGAEEQRTGLSDSLEADKLRAGYIKRYDDEDEGKH